MRISESHSNVDHTNKRGWFIALFFYATTLTDIIRAFSNVINSSGLQKSIELFRNLLYVLIFVGYWFFSTKNAKKVGLIGVLFYCLILLVSILLNPLLQDFAITISLLFISRYILAFVMICQLEDPKLLISLITKLSWIIPIYVFLYSISTKDVSNGYAYSMTFSYNLLIPAIACFYSMYCYKEHIIQSFLVDIASLIGIILYGSRGTIVCIGFAFIYIIIFQNNNLSYKRTLISLLFVILIFLVLLEKDLIIYRLAQYFPNSRTLFLLLKNGYLSDSNRNIYYTIAKEHLQENPFSVLGLAGDAFLYGNYMGISIELGRHSHNIILEILVSYGVIIGGLLSLNLIFRIVITLIRARHSQELKELCSLIIVPLIPYVFISGSLCQSYQHWLLIGAIYSILSKKQGYNKANNSAVC